ncbi:MAG: DUF2141 domain-containing protein [Halioglobus sp.]
MSTNQTMTTIYRTFPAALFSTLLLLTSMAQAETEVAAPEPEAAAAEPAAAVAVSEVAVSAVQIELSGLADAEGNIFVSVYNSADDWLSDNTVMTNKVDIADNLDGDIMRYTLELPPGDYALSIFFDANGNDDMDTNFIGIPKEPVAMSNNARPKFGPPKYKDAVFTLGEEVVVQQITIKAI